MGESDQSGEGGGAWLPYCGNHAILCSEVVLMEGIMEGHGHERNEWMNGGYNGNGLRSSKSLMA